MWILIFFWIACIAGTGAILGYKSIKSPTATWLSILLGPVGVIYAFTLPPSTELWPICPFCAERIRAEAVVCKHCRRDLPRA